MNEHSGNSGRDDGRSGSRPGTPRPALDRFRIWAASVRYDFWLDLRSVPAKRRRALRSELRSNLGEAAASVGASEALARLGSLRLMAREAVHDDVTRPRWLAGWWTGLTTLVTLLVGFLFMTVVYAEGVLDSGATEPVSSGLFPFLGSQVTVDPATADGGLSFAVSPGPVPFVVALVVFVAVAKPWRLIGSPSHQRSVGASL